ncbi:DNA helicase PcrA [Lyngbya sp. CCY1209]|uniref:DNA helicase PcrA n=1 Tax=Lyngbya sp. CCY1209 TaxID=2886103 RepID=UPI002D2152F5|nr:DNA helicase PcrA [Lyngbya sp. CCY1209]MEB3884133.1 DNA helicase PcrA [Lyngbya sp. CCY1209]
MQTVDFLTTLNPSQRQAVEHFCGPMLVVAGAGSGKTRALTYRVANLIHTHRVNPENILAVTFTNKAAREIKERVESIFAQQQAQKQYGKPLSALEPAEQTQLRSHVYRTLTKHLWMGTFHSLCARILRYDINKYQDEKGRQWQQNFSIFDESDAQAQVKQIVTKQLNLDDKKFDPRKIRYKISNAKNLGLSPQEYSRENPDYSGRVISEVYGLYQDALAANNALDFDDLIRVPVALFRQNEQVLAYWHQKFRHILVDEYQDTNRTQYDLIRLLATNGEEPRSFENWKNRSIFVVGDVDQSIYSFRMADYTILLEFQDDFGDGLSDDDTRTLIKLEENYRSRENILEVANHLIQNNTARIEKVLRPTRSGGTPIYCYQADEEIAEAQFVVDQIKMLIDQNPELGPGSFAILYRTNAQSRPFEDVLLRNNILYNVVGGLKFYDRKEIKDALSYLRVLANPADSVSLQRIINVPRRGIGRTTLDGLNNAAQQLGVPLWEIVGDEDSVNTVAGRSAKSVNRFAQIIQSWRDRVETTSALDILEGILADCGYFDDLKNQGTDEADNRLDNLRELCNAVSQYQEEYEDSSLQGFLASASLSSDLDNLEEGQQAVSLMTLHSAKGLEFPIVFLVGLEQGLFPNFRSIDDPLSLEEERRLCYVGITRAQEQLFITHALERRLWGYREPCVPSMFLKELPENLIEGYRPFVRPIQKPATKKTGKKKKRAKPTPATNPETWKVGDRVFHTTFGVGKITHIFGGNGGKQSLAIKFHGSSPKILDPSVVPLQSLE